MIINAHHVIHHELRVKDMAQVLNQYFTTVFTDENMDNIPESRCLCSDENILKDVDVSYEAVLKKLDETDPEKAPGDDSIHPVILRKLAQHYWPSHFRSMMFTRSLKSGQVPQVRLETGKRDSYI